MSDGDQNDSRLKSGLKTVGWAIGWVFASIGGAITSYIFYKIYRNSHPKGENEEEEGIFTRANIGKAVIAALVATLVVSLSIVTMGILPAAGGALTIIGYCTGGVAGITAGYKTYKYLSTSQDLKGQDELQRGAAKAWEEHFNGKDPSAQPEPHSQTIEMTNISSKHGGDRREACQSENDGASPASLPPARTKSPEGRHFRLFSDDSSSFSVDLEELKSHDDGLRTGLTT